MDSSKARSDYVATFTHHLVSSTSGKILKDNDNDFLKVVEETFDESVQHLEDRFNAYLTSYSHLTVASALRTAITSSEEILHSKFKLTRNEKRSPIVDSTHRQALRQCSAEIMKDLDLPGSSLLDDLMECDLLSVSDKDSIRGQSTRKRQNEEFYAYIEGRLTYDDFYNKFHPALRKQHPHLSDALITVLDQLEDENHESTCLPCRTRRIVQLKRLAAPLLQKKLIDFPVYLDLRSHQITHYAKWVEIKKTVSDEDIIQALEKKYPDFHREFLLSDVKSLECSCQSHDVAEGCGLEPEDEPDQKSGADIETCATDFSAFDDVTDEDLSAPFFAGDLKEEYKMAANPRGKCLIINNMSMGRKGYIKEHDVTGIVETFKRLQFDVRVYNDLTAKETVMQAYEFAQQDHSAYDAFVCVIMSGGSSDYMQGSDKLHFKQEDVIHHFYAHNCPSLAGKPKIFLFEADRGTKRMSYYHKDGVDVADGADFVIGHSTEEGFQSLHSRRKGSVFFTSLTDVLKQHADKHDFLSCLTMTNRAISEKMLPVREGEKVKQISAPAFTLTKKLYLTSDPAWSH